MANVLLGVTGSVAAVRVPSLYQALRLAGHEVKVVATAASLYFFDPAALDPSRPGRDPNIVILDDDEWPGRAEGQRYVRDDPVLHIELRRWADLLLIAPLDANTLAKLANGLADNSLTCVWRAWDPARPVLVAPAMNTLMWDHPATARHLRQLAADAGAEPPTGLSPDQVVDWINGSAARLRVAAPQAKRLACGDVGRGAMAEVDELVRWVERCLGGGRHLSEMRYVMSYQDFTLPRVLADFGLTVRTTSNLFSRIAPIPVRLEFATSLASSACLGLANSTDKARSEWLIAPLLLELWELAGQRVGLFCGFDFDVDPAAGLNGTCDFILGRGSQLPYVTDPVVCIVEGKNESIPSGLGPCAAAMVAAHRFNAQAKNGIETIYGAVTTGSNWKFLVLQPPLLTVETNEYQIFPADQVLGILLHMVGPLPHPRAPSTSA